MNTNTFTLDFSKEYRSEIVFPNLWGQNNTINFTYKISPIREGEPITLTFWGLTDTDKVKLWTQYMFAQTPNNSSFNIKFDDLARFKSFSLVADKGSGAQFTRATLSLQAVAEPSFLGLFFAISLVAFIGYWCGFLTGKKF